MYLLELKQKMSETPNTTPVYRIENPNIPSSPNGITSHEELVGQWFSPNVETALGYLRKSTQTFGRDAAPVDGAQLVVAHVPTDQLEALHVSSHPIAAKMDVEDDNYIVPRDGSIPTDTIPLDDKIGDLRGQLGNLYKYREASDRVRAVLGGVAIKK
jgi:hypothetical protein